LAWAQPQHEETYGPQDPRQQPLHGDAMPLSGLTPGCCSSERGPAGSQAAGRVRSQSTHRPERSGMLCFEGRCGGKKPTAVLLYPLLTAYKAEPETFGLGFVLLIFLIRFDCFHFCLGFFITFFLPLQLDIQVLSILFLWKVLWMG